MKNPLFIQNIPIDEKRIAFIERIVTRLTRRTNKTAKALLTPYPISNAVISEEVKGVVLRYMFPCEGKITKGVIDIGKRPKQDVVVSVSLMGEEKGESRDFILTKRRLVIEPGIKVSTFNQLAISISYEAEKPEDNITEFWTAFLWVPEVKEVEVKSLLIDELDNNDLSEE